MSALRWKLTCDDSSLKWWCVSKWMDLPWPNLYLICLIGHVIICVIPKMVGFHFFLARKKVFHFQLESCSGVTIVSEKCFHDSFSLFFPIVTSLFRRTGFVSFTVWHLTFPLQRNRSDSLNKRKAILFAIISFSLFGIFAFFVAVFSINLFAKWFWLVIFSQTSENHCHPGKVVEKKQWFNLFEWEWKWVREQVTKNIKEQQIFILLQERLFYY